MSTPPTPRCGKCVHSHPSVAFFVPHHGLCVHCDHPDEEVRGDYGWGTLRRYKEGPGCKFFEKKPNKEVTP